MSYYYNTIIGVLLHSCDEVVSEGIQLLFGCPQDAAMSVSAQKGFINGHQIRQRVSYMKGTSNCNHYVASLLL